MGKQARVRVEVEVAATVGRGESFTQAAGVRGIKVCRIQWLPTGYWLTLEGTTGAVTRAAEALGVAAEVQAEILRSLAGNGGDVLAHLGRELERHNLWVDEVSRGGKVHAPR